MIVAAAILGPDGLIHTLPRPARHHHIIQKMADQGMRPPPPDAQGFLTNTGHFLGRIGAGELAIEKKQITALRWPDELYSEDLW